MASPAEPAKVAQLDRSAVDMVDLSCWLLVAANAAAVVLRQYFLAELVAQSWSGVAQVEGEEVIILLEMTSAVSGSVLRPSRIACRT